MAQAKADLGGTQAELDSARLEAQALQDRLAAETPPPAPAPAVTTLAEVTALSPVAALAHVNTWMAAAFASPQQNLAAITEVTAALISTQQATKLRPPCSPMYK